MDIDVLLADSVVAAEGKLYIQGGGWNSIFVQSFPSRHPRLGIGVVIRVPYTATNQSHKFEFRIAHSDGQLLALADAPPGSATSEEGDGKVYTIGGTFTVGRPPEISPGDDQVVPLAVNVDGLVFPTPDRYTLSVFLDGTEMETLPFRVANYPGGVRMGPPDLK